MSYDARMASATIVSDSTARAVYATVRIQVGGHQRRVRGTTEAAREFVMPRHRQEHRPAPHDRQTYHAGPRRRRTRQPQPQDANRGARFSEYERTDDERGEPPVLAVIRRERRRVDGAEQRVVGDLHDQISPVIAQVAPRVPAGSMSTGFRPRRLDARRAVRSPARRFCAPGRCNGDRPRYKCTPTFAPRLPWRGRWCGARSGAHVAGRGAHPRRARRCACGTHAG